MGGKRDEEKLGGEGREESQLAFDERHGAIFAAATFTSAGKFFAAEVTTYSLFFFGFCVGGGDSNFATIHLPSTNFRFFTNFAFFEGIGGRAVHGGFAASFEGEANVHHVDDREAELGEALFFFGHFCDLSFDLSFHRSFIECVSSFYGTFFTTPEREGKANNCDPKSQFFHFYESSVFGRGFPAHHERESIRDFCAPEDAQVGCHNMTMKVFHLLFLKKALGKQAKKRSQFLGVSGHRICRRDRWVRWVSFRGVVQLG